MIKLNLRARVMLGLVAFGGALTIIAVQVVDIANDDIEETILNGFLNTELERLLAGAPENMQARIRTNPAFKSYLAYGNAPRQMAIPAVLAPLGQGFHEDVTIGDRLHYVSVSDRDGMRIYIAYDITQIEETEDAQDIFLLLGTILIVLASLIVGYFVARLLVAPVDALARQVGSLSPSARGTRLKDTSHMDEVAVIVHAVNAFMARLDGFVEREQEFTATVSHELRTPIAVIASSTDVLGALKRMPRSAARPIGRIVRASKDMEEVITALLYLAKESDFAEKGEPASPLDEIIFQIVEDHHYLTEGKKISVNVRSIEPTLVSAPRPILTIAIGNIVRNAIENTEQGSVEIDLASGVLLIRNSGQVLPAERSAHLFHERLRDPSQKGEGKGLGIYIIKRICARFGWEFSIEGTPNSGTTVRLDLSKDVMAGSQAAHMA